ncbi:MAG: TIGR03545 family protein [Pirellulaceae bacterium]|nr:TIGR03545 family protein [Pirellulaceae bacterium]
MIRWKYVVPRLLAVAAVALFVVFGLDPLLRWSLASLGSRIVGAKVEIDSVQTSLTHTKLKMTGLAVANPKSPMENLAQADSVVVDLNSNAFFRRQFVVDQAAVHGLVVSAPRDESGELDDKQIQPPRDAGFALPELNEQWVKQLGEDGAKGLIAELESVRLADQLAEKWKTRYETLEQQARMVPERIKWLRQLYERTDRNNPLQVAEALDSANRELVDLRAIVNNIRFQVRAAPNEARADWASLEAARQRDLTQLRQRFHLDALEEGKLSNYFLEAETQRRLATVFAWVNRCRQLLEVTSEPEAKRFAGEDVHFASLPPDLWIRRMSIDGMADIDDKQFPFVAYATDVSTQPARLDRPTVLRLQAKGDVAVLAHATIDYRLGVARQHYVIDIPELVMQERTWGDADKISLEVGRSRARIWCELTLEYGELAGRLIFQQPELDLQPRTRGRLGERFDNNLATALTNVNSLEAVVSINGPPRRPKVELESNLGGQVATA